MERKKALKKQHTEYHHHYSLSQPPILLSRVYPLFKEPLLSTTGSTCFVLRSTNMYGGTAATVYQPPPSPPPPALAAWRNCVAQVSLYRCNRREIAAWVVTEICLECDAPYGRLLLVTRTSPVYLSDGDAHHASWPMTSPPSFLWHTRSVFHREG